MSPRADVEDPTGAEDADVSASAEAVLTDEESELADLQRLVQTLGAARDERRLLEGVHRLFARELDGDPDPDTAYGLIDSLAVLLDDDVTAIAVVNLVARSQADPTFRARALHEAPPELASALRELVALYGKQAKRALLIQGADSLGWSDFARYVYRELVANQWRIRVVVTLNNGQDISIRDTPESIAVLAEAVLDTLTYLPPQVMGEMISNQRRERLRDVFRRFDSVPQDGSISQAPYDGEDALVPVPAEVSSPDLIQTDAYA